MLCTAALPCAVLGAGHRHSAVHSMATVLSTAGHGGKLAGKWVPLVPPLQEHVQGALAGWQALLQMHLCSPLDK